MQRRTRLGLKRATQDGQKRAATQPPEQRCNDQMEHEAAERGEVEQQQAPMDVVPPSPLPPHDTLNGGAVPATLENDEAQQGLLKIADSLRRRVDEGRLELLRMQRLQQQKERLVVQGEAVLAEHCAASWQRQQRQAHTLPQELHVQEVQQGNRIGIHSLHADCAAGQWWLRADISLPAQLCSNGCRQSLLASSTQASLVCRQQHSTQITGNSSIGRSSDSRMNAQGAGMQRLQLTAALDIEKHQDQAGEALWADVFVMIEQPARRAQAGIQAFDDRTAVPAPPQQLGRVQLSWAEWLGSHSRPAIHAAEQSREQASIALAVSSQQLDLQCLSHIARQHLACMPVAPSTAAEAGQPASATFVLRGPPTGVSSLPGDVPLPTVAITQHSSQFAEVHLQASDVRTLDVMRQQLSAGLGQAAQQAGLPADDVDVQRSLLGPQHAQQQAAASEALVQELDASIAWVESLLQQKLALGSQQRRQKHAAPSDTEVMRKQAAALTAMAATDERMVSLLTS